MIDIENLICVNTQLFSEALQLGSVFSDKNSAGAMKDEYIVLLFSWNTLVESLRKGRYDAAFFILPYVYLMEAIHSPTLSLQKRLEFLNESFNIFRKHYILICNAPKSDLFRKRFKQCCIGVYYGEKVFLRRIMNTIIGISVALIKGIDYLSLQRLESHDAELFFATMRFFSFFDNTYENAIRVAVRSILLKKYSHDVDFKLIINKRENNARIQLNSQINQQENIELNCEIMTNIIYDLMLGNSVSDENYHTLSKFVNNYSDSITSCKDYKLPKKLHMMSGRLPFYRYQTMSYIQSVMLVPHKGSIFDFYLKNKNKKKTSEQINTLQWCLNVMNALDLLNKPENKDIISDIPFEYDIVENNDRIKILSYINDEIIAKNMPKNEEEEEEAYTEQINEDQNSDSDDYKIDAKDNHDDIFHDLDKNEIDPLSQLPDESFINESIEISQKLLCDVEQELKHGQEEQIENQPTTNKELNEPTQFLLRKN